jgi:hypothetical protein
MGMSFLYLIIVLVSTIYIGTTILGFFGIGVEVYGIYLVILIGIILLYGVLPEHSGGIFLPK